MYTNDKTSSAVESTVQTTLEWFGFSGEAPLLRRRASRLTAPSSKDEA